MKNKDKKIVLRFLLHLDLNFELYFKSGLCKAFSDMFSDYNIKRKSRIILFNYLRYNGINTFNQYNWTPGAIKPRRKWLKKHIKKLCKELSK